ncbi:MAG: primary replicative helicase [Thermoleophilia bacterium]|nr:primary replicative helicase [Thermoleophilia bacterium]MCZ4495900.1 primary replicative helicase [Thermoleophilia bacterium]
MDEASASEAGADLPSLDTYAGIEPGTEDSDAQAPHPPLPPRPKPDDSGQRRRPTDQPSHLPPQSLEAEEAILGAMLMSGTAIEAVTDLRLRERDFYRPSHRTIFRVILELADRDAVDELTVVNELKHQNLLTEVGGSAAIITLAERVPAVANARAYAQEVIDQATLRSLVETGHEIARLGYEHPEEPEKLVDMAGGLIGDLASNRSGGDFVDASELLGPIYDELTERAESGEVASGLITGFHDFDKRTGGLQAGNLVIVAGRPGMGKTSWAMNVAENIVIDGEGAVAMFSLEMEPKDLMTRVMCSVAKVDQHRIRVGTPNEQDWPHLVDAVGKLMQPDRLFIADTRDLTPMTLRTQCRRLAHQMRNKGGLKLIIIDYIQIMEAGRRFDGETAELTYISRQLKSLALELSVPVIALSQLNRSVEQRPDKRPLMSDLRGSGSIEQDADIIIFLYRPEYYTKDETPPEWQGKAELIVAKHRNGQPGNSILGFLGKYTKFVNLTQEAVAEARDNRPGRPAGVPTSSAIAAAAGSSAPAPPKPADTGTFGAPNAAPPAPFQGEDFGLPAPPPDAYGDIT